MSGSIKAGDRVRVLGEAYTPDDEEDSASGQVRCARCAWLCRAFHAGVAQGRARSCAAPCCQLPSTLITKLPSPAAPMPQVTSVWAYQARYRVPLTRAVAGTWVLLEGELEALLTCYGAPCPVAVPFSLLHP